MAFYDRIAGRWHKVTGHHGGAFKRLVLNDRLLERIGRLSGLRVLELGCGNGYFLPLALRRGGRPERLVITDASAANLATAQSRFPLPEAEHQVLDVAAPFPFRDGDFDLVLATMVFQELSDPVLRHALGECRRVLADEGRLLMTVLHPAFVRSLRRRDLLRRQGRVTLMPGAEGLWLPVSEREEADYEAMLAKAGLTWEAESLVATEPVLRAKPGLRQAGAVPIALVVEARVA